MKLFINEKKYISVNQKGCLEEALSFLQAALSKAEITGRGAMRSELLAEEMIVRLIQNAGKDAVLKIGVWRFLGDTSITLSMKGEEFDPYEAEIDLEGFGAQDDPKAYTAEDDLENKSQEDQSEENPQVNIDEKTLDEFGAENAIRSLILKAHGENFKYNHKNHTNYVRIMAGQAEQSMVYITLAALLLGLVFGVFAKWVFPAVVTDALCSNLLTPVKTMFMNALKIVIAPVVFFSIVTCVSQFKNIADLGKIGGKVMSLYLATTVIAVLLGILVVTIIKPAPWGFALTGNIEAASVTVNTDVDTSLINKLINIIPSNFVQPFLDSNMLQVMFLSILCGIAVGFVGDYSNFLKEMFEALNSLFQVITRIIVRVIPLAVFCSIVLMVVNTGGTSLLSMFKVAGTTIFTFFLMMIVYSLLIMVFARLNPLTFFRKSKEGLLTSFSLSSSSAAMPTNLRVCKDNLGVSPKVCNFSIPLGATVNMDGTCIYLSVISLSLARAYGVDVPPASMLPLVFTIIILSLGAPGVPGAGLVCLGIVLEQLHVPLEALSLIMALSPLIEMFNTLSNVTGDLAATLVVARSEGLIDMEKFNR